MNDELYEFLEIYRELISFYSKPYENGRSILVSELPDRLSKSITQSNIRTLTKQTDYSRAKNNGDEIAALNVVIKLVKADKIKLLKESLIPNKEVIYIPVINTEKNLQLNQIPIAYAHVLKNYLGGSVCLDIVKTGGTPNTNENINKRITKGITFDGAIPTNSAQYIITDDNFTSGRTVLALMEHLKEQGADIRAVTTLGFSRYTYYIKQQNQKLEQLRELIKLPENHQR